METSGSHGASRAHKHGGLCAALLDASLAEPLQILSYVERWGLETVSPSTMAPASSDVTPG